MSDEIKVGISDYKIGESPDKLITLGLGSCVGIAIYNKSSKVGGLSHIMLPDSTFFMKDLKPEKFADLAIPKMVSEITKGRSYANLVAKIAGGASMFNFADKKTNTNIGERNVLAVQQKLKELGIPILASDTGGSIGRTMIVDLESFVVKIRTANREITIL
ncbi:chemotaxis protein CheD [Alkalibaculum bacchi]|uniref:Probable chemoreceptor glutamine deamidase CheD n=1 Tax=Alkalibaculum bacchi TaxID=645887 RepID=A0A366IFM0_9FIRM|nr:chemotaxis protein CheD [Alkalibaculum bacchi]RBP70136.1 chemotaxis protein CheD [Alkalibaculum bacchi]